MYHQIMYTLLFLIDSLALDGDAFHSETESIHGGIYHCAGTEARLDQCGQQERECDQNDIAAVRCNPGMYIEYVCTSISAIL